MTIFMNYLVGKSEKKPIETKQLKNFLKNIISLLKVITIDNDVTVNAIDLVHFFH